MKKSEPFKIAVLPLGLIGGSLVKALARARREGRCPECFPGGLEVLGFTTRPEAAERVRRDQVCDRVYEMPRIGPSYPWREKLAENRDLLTSDLIILCTPVELIPPLAAFLAERSNAWLSDVGSVKGPVMEAVRGLPFIGGHPMAGSERTGYFCSDEALFDHACYVICPPLVPVEGQDSGMALMEKTAELLGARSLRLSASEHDRLVARISHLPHVTASALVHAALARDDRLAILLSAGGFRDITRIASSDPGLWAGISLESGEPLKEALDDMIACLQEVRSALDRGDEAMLRRFFRGAGEKRAWVPEQGVGPLVSDVQILLNIEDRPGVLAKLTALLSEADINIHNLSIQDARQYEGGQVRLFISSPEEARRARELLALEGYELVK